MDWDEIRADRRASAGDDRRPHRQPLQSEAAGRGRGAPRDRRDAVDIIAERTGRDAAPSGLSLWLCQRGRLPRGRACRAKPAIASAVTTRHGVLRAEHAGHLHALPRISVNGRYQSVAHIRTMLSGVTTPLANAGKMAGHGLTVRIQLLRPRRQHQPLDDAHGRQHPEQPAEQEEGEMHQRSGFATAARPRPSWRPAHRR